MLLLQLLLVGAVKAVAALARGDICRCKATAAKARSVEGAKAYASAYAAAPPQSISTAVENLMMKYE